MALALGLTGLVALGIKAHHDTMEPPLVRETQVAMPGLSTPLRVLLISDIHVSGPDMPPERLAQIIEGLNRLHPDLVLIAGDFLSDKLISTKHYPLVEAVAPLKGLRSRLGTVAVLGNHDYYRDPVATKAALEHLGIRVLVNEAARIGGLTIGGMTDAWSHHAREDLTLQAMRRSGPPYLFLTHEPDTFAHLPPDIPLMLAGHTHCGQIALPLIGTPITGSRYGQRYACGLVKEHGATLIVTAGLGTSDLPFRFGVHGDVWLMTMTPAPSPPKP
ncbi:metallophosphoesterase [Novosphingobium terrae]|uniref:metallophosphoesterase n=1 Tax=Novosphingobium terrae TaxID=2726189 RepID=UPI0019815835|nr:metallophosphoesterase [Novosphingobium terrae]